jgi:lipoprotein-anchoring transpeptidase ErfK/SrfK
MEGEGLSRTKHRKKKKKFFMPMVVVIMFFLSGVVASIGMWLQQQPVYATLKKKAPIPYKLKKKAYDEKAVKLLTAAVPNQLLIVNRQQNKLYFYEKGKLVRTFSVATGKSSTQTPDGVFPIVNKIKNRPYYTKKIPGGDPRNPLGDRWMGLDVNGTKGTTYAIHGNNNPAAIGRYTTLGCIRMHNKDIHWLFERLQTGTKVIVTNSKASTEQIALGKGFKLYAS